MCCHRGHSSVSEPRFALPFGAMPHWTCCLVAVAARDSHMWLFPILGKPNKVVLRFPKPVEVTMVKVWNYSKTATRGIKEFDMVRHTTPQILLLMT